MKNYFKKIIIMFVMAITIMLGNFTNAFAADTTVIWNTYDDHNTMFTYENLKDWSNGNTNDFLNGGTYMTDDMTKKSSAKFNFIGTQFKLKVQCYIGGRNNNINAYIDGKVYNFSAPQTLINGHAQYYQSPELNFGEHSVSIEKAEPYNDGFILFDQVDINGDLKPYNANISSISLNKFTDNLQVGQTDNLVATTTPAGAELVWSSSDTSVATVDSNGKVTGIKEGQSTITAQIKGSETKATCTVNVTKATDPIQPTNPTDNTGGTDETTNIVNIAHAKGDNTNNAGGSVSIIFKGVADAQLSVVKTADVDSVYVGDTFTYTIVVTNTSSKTAKAVVVNDNAPNHINFSVSGVTTTQGSVDPSSTSKNIIVNVGDIPPLGTVTIKIPATVIL